MGGHDKTPEKKDLYERTGLKHTHSSSLEWLLLISGLFEYKTLQSAVWYPEYRGTSNKINFNPPRTTIGP